VADAPRPPRIRLLTPEDRTLLAALAERVSPETAVARFHGPVSVLTDRMLDRLLDLEPGRHEAVIAEDGKGIVGVARYVRDDPSAATAEVAIVIADDCHHVGVGRALMTELAAVAHQAGITRFRASVLATNDVARRFITALAPNAVTHPVGDEVVFLLNLADA